MNTKARRWSLTARLCLGATIALCLGEFHAAAKPPRSEKQAVSNSVARFAIDDFFAACSARPKRLLANPYFSALPLYFFLPDPVSLDRLDKLGVEELAVFCACPDENLSKVGRPAPIRWAAAAQVSKDIDLEETLRQWHQAIVPADKEPRAKPVAVEIDGHHCFQVPAGSFFEPPRTYGALRFTDRSGKPSAKGINIGRVNVRRGYAEGATGASAIFTFDHVDESVLVDGQLPLEIYPAVFETYYLGKDYSLAQIELRNPATGLRSEPITFQPESYVRHRLSVPSNLTAVDGNEKRGANLLKDFVSRGKIEVIVKGCVSAVYIGVGPEDLYLRRRAFEYVYISGREIVVAQSQEILRQMMRAAQSPTALANRLARSIDDLVIVAQLSDPSRRNACERLLTGIGDELNADLLGDGWTDIALAVATEPALAGQITARFANSDTASHAASHFKQLLRSARANAGPCIKDLLVRGDAMAGILSIPFLDVSTRFPPYDSLVAKSRESNLLALIDGAFNSIHLDADGKSMTVQFTEPANLARLWDQAEVALANLDEAFARDLFERERYDLSLEMYRSATDRFPHVPQLWLRRAHQMAYNTSVQFTRLEDRYAWVRQGVMILLDGMEQNPDRIEFTWLTGRFIGWKIGTADERVAYRQLFSQDKVLQQRLARFVDLERAKAPDKTINNWLVAKMLCQKCAERLKPGEHPAISPLWIFARLDVVQARYAESLSESGQWVAARQAWTAAEQSHREMAARTIVLPNSQSVRLDELKRRLAESGQNDGTVKLLQATRSVIAFDYWQARCELEQTEKMQSARRLSQQAANDARQSRPKQAFNLYRQSLETLDEIYNEHPQQMALIAGDFQRIATGYRKVAPASAGSDAGPLAPILSAIEKSKLNSRNLFLDP